MKALNYTFRRCLLQFVSNTWCNFSAFRAEFLKALNSLGPSSSRGYYINSCYAHCQTGTQETWLRDDSPVLSGTVCNQLKNYFKIMFIIHKPLYPRIGRGKVCIHPLSGYVVVVYTHNSFILL